MRDCVYVYNIILKIDILNSSVFEDQFLVLRVNLLLLFIVKNDLIKLTIK